MPRHPHLPPPRPSGARQRSGDPLAELTDRVGQVEKRILAGFSEPEANQLRTLITRAARLAENGGTQESACEIAESLDLPA
ncbi:hypothetical protein [Compostimonas suwonensis]|uniref:Uncharacterized protein n=1 Tax=Compostimonas suwonensis TaxID=1048394 RepID=A0A2M9BVV4_9MICO|nr:hypothetical protein [Compostimonas suwonensis]PJJ62065.1 hypothetical protein CLV54_1858 [Compostimonas suwonensis]